MSQVFRKLVAGEANSPPWQNLAKEGWTRHQENIPVPLIGADGVVRSKSKTISLERTTPSAPAKVASRHFLKWAQPPPLSQGGEFASSPRLRQQSNAYTSQA